MICVMATGVGTPFGFKTLTSASPVPSDVRALSIAKYSLGGNVDAVALRSRVR